MGIFQLSFFYWFLVQFHCVMKAYTVWFLFFCLLRCILRSRMWSWWIFLIILRICILLLLHEVVYRYQLYPINRLEVNFVLDFRLLTESIEKIQLWVDSFIFPCSSKHFCLTYFDVLLLNTYKDWYGSFDNLIFYYYLMALYPR